MDTANFNKNAKEMCEYIANQMKINLGAKVKRKSFKSEWQNGKPKNTSIKTFTGSHSASGRLIDSIKVGINAKGNYGIFMDQYGKYVNEGRQPGKGIPLDAMESWVKNKRLKPRNSKTGEFLKNTKNNRNAMAFCMNRKIKWFGIEAYPFIEMSVKVGIDKYSNKISDGISQDLSKYISTTFQKAKK